MSGGKKVKCNEEPDKEEIDRFWRQTERKSNSREGNVQWREENSLEGRERKRHRERKADSGQGDIQWGKKEREREAGSGQGDIQ